ncbi:hypothetical protein LTR84_001868 [Exophiala bonariae]|uniref:Uncharacterized protein n=1 Tax=Exophiala bonariae TaxID=1690606 RepID=A0AAV9NFD0_9EURO|nr:hypothetical protein LTR84_001868 [Exophiala bonariae]
MLYHILPFLPLVVILAMPTPPPSPKRNFLPRATSAGIELEERDPQSFGILPPVVPLPTLPTAVPLPPLPTAVPLPTLPTTIRLPTIGFAAYLDGNGLFVTLTAGNHFTNFAVEADVGVNITRRGHKVRRGWNGNFTSESADAPKFNSTAGWLLGNAGNFTAEGSDFNRTAGWSLGADRNVSAGGGLYLYCTQVLGF